MRASAIDSSAATRSLHESNRIERLCESLDDASELIQTDVFDSVPRMNAA